MTFDTLGTVNVLGSNNKGASYIYNDGQAGIVTIGTIDNNNTVILAGGAPQLTLTPTGTATFANTVASGRVTAQTASFASISVGPATPGTIKTRFSGADTYTIPSGFAYYNSSAWGTLGPGNSGSVAFSMEIDNRVLLRNELNITSDRRIKGDIAPINVDGVIDSLDAVQYTLNSEENKQPHVGFIAQDVVAAAAGKSYLPALVSIIPTDELNDMHVLDKNALLAVLWQTVKSLSERVKRLESYI
jgi:hypothetical protein